VYAVVVRWGLPESVRFLEQRGRYDEAEAAVRGFEEAAGVAPPARPAPEATAPVKPPPGPSALWQRGVRGRTISLWLVWFGVNFSYYGAFIWIPTLLVASGMDLVRSFGFTLIITAAQLPGYAVAAVLVEVWGRRPTLSVFLAGSAVSAVLFGNARSEAEILVFGMLLSAFNLGAWGALYAISPEVYPTALRGTGTGWAAGFGRIASVLAPLAVPRLLDLGQGTGLLFAVFAGFFALAAAATWGLPERRGEPIDGVAT
jgi:putative MFS transporter